MGIWFRESTSKLTCLFFGEEGATTVEYAVIVVTIILAAIAIIYILAAPDGTGVIPNAFSRVGNQVGQFGKIE